MNANPHFIPILQETLARSIATLPTDIQIRIQSPQSTFTENDFEWNSHNNYDIFHYRSVLFPSKKSLKPKRFWNSEHAMYEIAVGYFQGTPGIQVQMLFGGHRSACGGGRYVRQVFDIFSIARKKNPRLRINGVLDEGNLSLVRVLPQNEIKEAAEEMAWIITETFPKIVLIPDAT